MSVIDQSTRIREGEQLDVQRVDAYLKGQLPQLEGELHISQFPGGASNLTYALSYDNCELVLRRPPFGSIAKSAHDMRREASVLTTIRPHYRYAPKVLTECHDQEIMGCDFFVMEKITGIIPRRNLPETLSLTREQINRFCKSGIDKLIELHAIEVENNNLQALGKGAGYVKRQIDGWSKRYRKAITEDAASFDTVIQWLNLHMPEDIKTCVIHNDFRFDNLVFSLDDPTQVIGVLDWEMATLGDPLMDLGNSLAYWVEASDPMALQQARLQPTHLEGMFTRREFIDYYLQRTALNVESFDFYEIYGIFRLAVIVQQIYYRYFHGHTNDKRFAHFAQFGAYLETRCLALIDKH